MTEYEKHELKEMTVKDLLTQMEEGKYTLEQLIRIAYIRGQRDEEIHALSKEKVWCG